MWDKQIHRKRNADPPKNYAGRTGVFKSPVIMESVISTGKGS